MSVPHTMMVVLAINIYCSLPASSKWPFDSPNGGHLSPQKVT